MTSDQPKPVCDKCADTVLPILDILPRLWAAGYETKEQDGRWWLFDKGGEAVCGGATFRALCVNIILAGL